jgi:hypothetical protein
MQQWQAHRHAAGLPGWNDYQMYEHEGCAGCAEGVVSRIGDTALELREPASSLPDYLIWFGLLFASPLVWLVFNTDMPNSPFRSLLKLGLLAVGAGAAWLAGSWIFTTLRALYKPQPPSPGLLFDRRGRRLWWLDGSEERAVPWDRIRPLYRSAGPHTEVMCLLVVDDVDALVFRDSGKGKPQLLMFFLPDWSVGHLCTQSPHVHRGSVDAKKAVFDFVASFMRHGHDGLPSIQWHAPPRDHERDFLDLARTLDFIAGPRASAAKSSRAACAVLMAFAAPLLLPAQWMHGLHELRRKPREWSASTLASAGVDQSPLKVPAGSHPLQMPMNGEQRALAWTWVASALAIYLIFGWQFVR